MPLKTEFLGWQHPILSHAADYLIERYIKEGHLDLHNVLLVLPGGRAGRQLQQTLTKHAADNAVPYLAPTTTTIGSLPERLSAHGRMAQEVFGERPGRDFNEPGRPGAGIPATGARFP